MRVGEKTKPIGRLRSKPANPKSEARSPKQTQNANAPIQVPTMSAPRQTKPILAEEASALMMDYGSLMIWGKAIVDAGGGRFGGTPRQTKPIFAVFGAKMEVPSENKANLTAASPSTLEIAPP